MPPAWPASVPMHWLPQPTIFFDSRYSMQSGVGPGEWGPVSSVFRNAASSPARLSQSERSTTHSPAPMVPCSLSQAFTSSAVSRKSGFSATSAERSMTLTGAIRRCTSSVSV